MRAKTPSKPRSISCTTGIDEVDKLKYSQKLMDDQSLNCSVSTCMIQLPAV